MSDSAARRIGRVTMLTIVALPVTALLSLLFSQELAWIIEKPAFWGALVALGFAAWSIAYVAMVLHQKQSGYVSEGDAAEWKAREETKLGVLVPFTYLLASPKQRRILTYLGKAGPTKKARRWYWSRF